jgi:hypothetical protein
MGHILAFEPRSAATSRKEPAAGVTASIVIFPGIRYERQPEAQDRQESPAEHQATRNNPRPRH